MADCTISNGGTHPQPSLPTSQECRQAIPDGAYAVTVFIASTQHGISVGASIARMFFFRYCQVKDHLSEHAYGVEVAVTEWLSNICRHGLNPDLEFQIEINLSACRGMLRITIRDNGTVFDPTVYQNSEVLPPDLRDERVKQNVIRDLKPGGNGLRIIRSQFHLQRVADDLYNNALLLSKTWSEHELEPKAEGAT